MVNALVLALFLPLFGFLVISATSSWIGRRAVAVIACGTLLISFLIFVHLLISYDGPQHVTLFHWIPVKFIDAEFALHLDSLSLLMTLIITGVGFLIHVYSVGYMEHEEDFARFFACLNFFVFAMLLLVLAANLLLLFVGWEGVGLASYLLIGYYYTRTSAAHAATKAFVINRVGDFGFLLGLLLTFTLFGTSDIATINLQAGQQYAIGAPIITLLTLLFFVGATGKSAQIPLHTWLADAMEGPTPVSALIHAATMVTAGVYLVVRLHPIYELAPDTLMVVGTIGTATALFAALCAIGQTDLKRVLAYSTVSQLGYMFLACGIGAYYAAMFHLTMHAFVKALLFLSAGSVVHGLNGATNMDHMGGLSKVFTKTHWLFLIGVLALSGIPPLAAFFSKDLILEQSYATKHYVLFFIGLVTAIITGFYLVRAYCLTFTGEPRLQPHVFKAAHEAPAIMLTPVTLLAILSIGGGLLGFALKEFLAESGVTLAVQEHGFELSIPMVLALVGAIAGVVIGAIVYTRKVERLSPPLPVLKRAFFIDDLYWNGIAVPLRALGNVITRFFEPKVFDGSITVAAESAQDLSQNLQQLQSGQIRSYVAWIVMGTAYLLFYFVS
ncbi:MAG: NADH-quinone oxidoreductase subunit L [Chlamydiales bacterium]|nr:NADH-quinone oxidoreductase subunit L [Chlamydiales bacterium]